MASLIHGIVGRDDLEPWGLGVELLARAVARLNVHLAAIRPRLHRARVGGLRGYRHVSGVPGIGSLLVVLGTVVGYGSVVCSIVGLIAVLADTGGSLWFLIATWHDGSMWDRS